MPQKPYCDLIRGMEMLDVLKTLLCAGGAVYLVIRVAGFLRLLAEGLASWRLDRRFATHRRNVGTKHRELATVSPRRSCD